MPRSRCCFCRAKTRKWKSCFLGGKHVMTCLKHFGDPELFWKQIGLIVAERQRLIRLEQQWSN